MVDVPSAILDALSSGGDGVRLLLGTFVSADTTGCWVDVQGSRIPAMLGTSWLPEVSEIVRLWAIDDLYFIMGPAAVKPAKGTVQSVAGGIVTLLSNISTTVVCPYTGTTPSAGQTMQIAWHGGPVASLLSTSPAGNTAPAVNGSGATAHADEFAAIDAGSYGSGRWWTNQVYASDVNLGAWFYGSAISDTIPSTATIQRVDIYVGAATQISGAAPNFATHGYQTKPGGAPTLSTVGAVAVVPGWVNLGSVGVAIGNAVKNGGGAFGVGVNHGGYNIFPSLTQDGYSGRLRITSVY